MDTSVRHFHIASISPQGVVLYESEYEFADASIADFIGLIRNVYAWQLGNVNANSYWQTLSELAVAENTASVTLGLEESLFKIFWTSCEGECNNGGPGRN